MAGNQGLFISKLSNLLKKGTTVVINGFFRASSTTKDCKTYRNTDMVVTSIEAIQDDEAGE